MINSIKPNINNKYNTNFGAIKSVKAKGLFNIHKNRDDHAAFHSIFLSDAFRYLIKNRNVRIEFDKFKKESENSVKTILHYEFWPIEPKQNNFLKRTLQHIKEYIIPNPKIEKKWIAATQNLETGEKTTLVKQIFEMTVDDMKKIMKE